MDTILACQLDAPFDVVADGIASIARLTGAVGQQLKNLVGWNADISCKVSQLLDDFTTRLVFHCFVKVANSSSLSTLSYGETRKIPLS